MKIGLVEEGFHNCVPDVVSTVREAAKSLSTAGATVTSISVPMHTDGGFTQCLGHCILFKIQGPQ